MRAYAYLRDNKAPLLDAPLIKTHKHRDLISQHLESDELTTPRHCEFRISVLCTDKANEVCVMSGATTLLRIYQVALNCEIPLMLPTQEHLVFLLDGSKA